MKKGIKSMTPDEIARLAELLLLHYRLSNEARQYRAALNVFMLEEGEDTAKDERYIAYLEERASEAAHSYLEGFESRSDQDRIAIFKYIATKIATRTPSGLIMEGLLVLNS